jgi:TM2 domain-containing membrane protein YozV
MEGVRELIVGVVGTAIYDGYGVLIWTITGLLVLSIGYLLLVKATEGMFAKRRRSRETP